MLSPTDLFIKTVMKNCGRKLAKASVLCVKKMTTETEKKEKKSEVLLVGWGVGSLL